MRGAQRLRGRSISCSGAISTSRIRCELIPPLTEAQLYQERQVQQGTDPTTSALLGGALNATVSNRVEKLFGVGSVKIDPAFVGTLGNSSARITVQQQISRQVTATFATNVNTSAQQLIQVQYDLNHDNSIVVTRDESGVFSIVYKLRKRYR
jgi:translocation and assembly module TamB